MKNGSQIMKIAQKEAARLGHNFVGTEHILLGVLGDGPGIASTMLNTKGVKSAVVRAYLEKTPPHKWPAREGEIPHTSRLQNVTLDIGEEARIHGYRKIDADHVLLSLLSQDDGGAAIIFKDAGIDRQALREELIDVLRPFRRS